MVNGNFTNLVIGMISRKNIWRGKGSQKLSGEWKKDASEEVRCGQYEQIENGKSRMG